MRYLPILAYVLLAAGSIVPGHALGQRIGFPDQAGAAAPPLVPVPQGNAAAPVSPQLPGATLGATIQPFDPYATPDSGQTPWPGTYGAVQPGPPPVASPPPMPGIGPLGPPPNLPGSPPSPYAQPGIQTSPWLPPAYGQPTPYDSTPYGQLPGNPQGPTNAVSGGPYQRLFQDTGFRYAWLYGKDERDLQMHEMEASTTAYFANLLGGLRVTPGFGLTLTDGPVTPDLPPQLYAAYLNFGLDPQFGPRLGAELTFRTGVYSDFQTFTNHSLRFIGTGVGVFRIAPTGSLKLGIAYIDRNDIKLLPAAGLLWEPNQQTRWDIFFPAPKLANYWTTIGNRQVWWYLGAEYGGGSWTIERTGDMLPDASERIDINDIRVYLGVEMWNLDRFYGFFEVGYVFDREIVYVVVPGDTTEVNDTFMLRAGVSF